MKKHLSALKLAIIVILLVLIVIFVLQNWNQKFIIFGIHLPVLLAAIGIFIGGWFSSKAVGGKVDIKDLKKQFDTIETKIDETLVKGIEEGQKVAEKAKSTLSEVEDKADAAAKTVKKTASKASDTAKKTVRKTTAAVKKATK